MIPKIPIVYYHSIAPINPNWNRNFLSVPPNLFEYQIKQFNKWFQIIDINEYYNIRSGQIKGPKNPLLITIDDGFLDNYIFAFPILKKHKTKATIFISPEMVDQKAGTRLNDSSNSNFKNGYMSWEEIKEMQFSGLIDFQSHTMSHTKFFVSDKITGFHHSNSDSLYTIGNIYPQEKPYHIANKTFQHLIPFGTPLFEEKSSVIAQKVIISEEFVNGVQAILSKKNPNNYSFNEWFSEIDELYQSYKNADSIIIKKETFEEQKKRIKYELLESKKIIESKLQKEVSFLCWPHGDNSSEVHQMALNSGYKATTLGKLKEEESIDRIGHRIGVNTFKGSGYMGWLKAMAKIYEYKGSFLFKMIKKVYKRI